MRIMIGIVFVIVVFGWMEQNSAAAVHKVAMYEQKLDRQLAIESLPARMVRK